uniref:PAN2-PAN3 deadenylation complex catalytic subunit PAN2 n=3 Tax=Hirondellea gigas TaxID=1518452 RepID=A0A6A7G785_9CRUS
MDYSGIQYIPDDIMVSGGYGEHVYGDTVNDPNMMAPAAGEMGDHTYMEQDNTGDFQCSTLLMDGCDQFSVSTVHLDSLEELAWAGNTGGHVTSYFNSPATSKYTSFQVQVEGDIRDICSVDPGVMCLTEKAVHMRSRYGLHKYKLQGPKLENLTTLCYIPHNNRIMVGGHQPTIVEYDVETQQETNSFTLGTEEDPGDCVILRNHNRFIIHGERKGRIAMHDPRSMREEHHFRAHRGSLSDFDVLGHYIATCGYTMRMSQEVEDQLLMVYDMRMMKVSFHLPCAMSPYLLRFVPGLSSCVAAVTASGPWNMLDIMQPETAMLMLHANAKQNSMMPGAFITSMSVATSSQALVFGDTHGHIHLWTQGSKPTFNNFSRESPYPGAPELTSIPITDQYTPLGTIPLDIPSEPLLSDWPSHLMATKYRASPEVEPKILSNMNMHGPVGYHPNTLGHNRNVVPYSIYRGRQKNSPDSSNGSSRGTCKVPQRYRRLEIKYGKLGIDDFDFDFYNRTSFAGLDMSLPNSYCNAMLQMFYYLSPLRTALLSHLCSREFCLACELGFLFHMLDISMNQGQPCNAANFLRAFRTIPEASAMSLTLSDSDTRSKVNLSTKIMSWNCFVLQQIKNELHCDLKEKAEAAGNAGEDCVVGSNLIDEVFGCDMSRVTRCTRCSHAHTKQTTSLLQILSLQEIMPEVCGNSSNGMVSLSAVVEACMCQNSTTQAWCEECNKYQPQQQLRTYQTLPNTLVLNTGLDNAQDLSYWQEQYRLLLTDALTANKVQDEVSDVDEAAVKTSVASSGGTSNNNNTTTAAASGALTAASRPCRYRTNCVRPDCKFWHPGRAPDRAAPLPGAEDVLNLLENTLEYSWVPPAMRARLAEDGSVKITDIKQEEFASASTEGTDDVIYDLVGVVSLITDPQFPDKNNLVATIKVGPAYHEQVGASSVDNWYLFNDISIAAISTSESVWFPTWKQPVILYWLRRELPQHLTSFTPISPVTRGVYLQENITTHKTLTFIPLAEDEVPSKDDLVAMDAEFVNLHQEEAEIRSDGTRTTIKPSHKAVARITCIRGQGRLEGTPFLDDYISTQEQVVDYLTQYSGIKPGDLDANYSQKHLTKLKGTYIKLRYLVDQGVKFVGHGLKNDFRVINMVVPPNQLLDTLHLFHMPHNRLLSLKFLAWHFLKLKIQSVTHDSIEDARTALALYKKYCELQANGTFRQELEALYQAGKKAQFQVPGEMEEE